MDGTNQGGSQGHSGAEKPGGLSWSQPQQPNSFAPKPFVPSTPPVAHSTQSAAPVITIPHADESTTSRTIAIVSGLVIVVALVAWMIASRSKTPMAVVPSSVATTTTTTPTNTATAGVELHGLAVPSPQDAGSKVTVSHIEVTQPTWVVVYENNNGKVGNVLGAATFFPGATSGSVELLRGTRAGSSYLVGETHDDGDGLYSLHRDSAVRDSNGSVSLIQFQTR